MTRLQCAFVALVALLLVLVTCGLFVYMPLFV
jgi:hypothetical protein